MKIFSIAIIILFTFTAGIQGQNYTLNTIFGGGAEKAGDMNSFTAEIKDIQGVLIYSITKQIDYDAPEPAAVLFDNGGCLVIYSINGLLEFYSRNGSLLTGQYIYSKPKIEYERSVFADAYGRKVALLVSEPELERYSFLKIYDDSGTMTAEYKINYELGGAVNFLKQDLLAISSYGWQGNRLNEQTLFLDLGTGNEFSARYMYSKYDFDQSSNLFAGYTNKRFFTIDLKSKNIKIVKEFASPEFILGAAFNSSGIILLTASNSELINGVWKYSETRLLQLNKNGEKISSKIVNKIFSAVRFEKKNGACSLYLDNELVLRN